MEIVSFDRIVEYYIQGLSIKKEYQMIIRFHQLLIKTII
jgi:hypothetical protein